MLQKNLHRHRLYGLLLIFLALAGCSGPIESHFGLVTRHVEGRVSPLPTPENQVLILALVFHRTFVETSQGPLHRASAQLVRPDAQGRYFVALADDVSRVDLKYLAKGYRTAYASFSRSLGVGYYSYDLSLKPDPEWADNYYFVLKPQLTGYLVEPRYQLAPQDILLLQAWLDQAEAGLSPPRTGRGAAP